MPEADQGDPLSRRRAHADPDDPRGEHAAPDAAVGLDPDPARPARLRCRGPGDRGAGGGRRHRRDRRHPARRRGRRPRRARPRPARHALHGREHPRAAGGAKPHGRAPLERRADGRARGLEPERHARLREPAGSAARHAPQPRREHPRGAGARRPLRRIRHGTRRVRHRPDRARALAPRGEPGRRRRARRRVLGGGTDPVPLQRAPSGGVVARVALPGRRDAGRAARRRGPSRRRAADAQGLPRGPPRRVHGTDAGAPTVPDHLGRRQGRGRRGGFGGGALGGVAGLSGPLPTIWCGLRGWSADTQRGVYQPFNLAILGLVLCAYACRAS